MNPVLLHYAQQFLEPLDSLEMLAEADAAMQNTIFFMNRAARCLAIGLGNPYLAAPFFVRCAVGGVDGRPGCPGHSRTGSHETFPPVLRGPVQR